MKGIPMKTWEVRAILDNRKTMTRRTVTPQPREIYHDGKLYEEDGDLFVLAEDRNGQCFQIAPTYRPGDILYVRETWYYETFYEDTDNPPDLPSGNRSWRYVYKVDNPDYPVIPGRWHPSIHMPREAARIFLRVTDVRVERLQDITEEQAEAEGACNGFPFDNYIDGFKCSVWGSTLKPADRALYGWDANPWVWVIEFERISREETQIYGKG